MIEEYLTLDRIREKDEKTPHYLSRKEYTYYHFMLPAGILSSDIPGFLELRLKNIYPGNLNATFWKYFIQGKSAFAVVMNGAINGTLSLKAFQTSYLPPSCQKKYINNGQFDAIIKYDDCYELFTVRNNCLIESHIISMDSNIDRKLEKAFANFAKSEILYVIDFKLAESVENQLDEKYNTIESCSKAEFSGKSNQNFYKLSEKRSTLSAIPQSLRIIFYVLISVFLIYLMIENSVSGKQAFIDKQEQQIKRLNRREADSVEKLQQISKIQTELKTISAREGIHVYSFLSDIAIHMDDVTIISFSLTIKDFILSGLHHNPPRLVSDLKEKNVFKTIELKNAVLDVDSNKQLFHIAGSMP